MMRFFVGERAAAADAIRGFKAALSAHPAPIFDYQQIGSVCRARVAFRVYLQKFAYAM